MKLAIDIGNTYIHVGLFKGIRLSFEFNIPTNKPFEAGKFHRQLKKITEDIHLAGISSVVPAKTDELVKFIRKYFGISPLIILNKNKLPVKIKVKNSNTLGPDRICNAVTGHMYFKGKYNVLICSFGTANTIDVVCKNGDFLGGIISPGFDLSAKVLNLNTGRLPLIKYSEIYSNKSVIGNDTKHAIHSGIMNCSVFATDGFIEEIKKELKSDVKIIITGGNGKYIQKKLKHSSVYIENTVLRGINYILDFNS